MSRHGILVDDRRWGRIEQALADLTVRQRRLLDASRQAIAEWELARAEWRARRSESTAAGEMFTEDEPQPPAGVGDQIAQIDDERDALRRERRRLMIEMAPELQGIDDRPGTAFLRERQIGEELAARPVPEWRPLMAELEDLRETMAEVFNLVRSEAHRSDPTGRYGLRQGIARPVRDRIDPTDVFQWVLAGPERGSLIGLALIPDEPRQAPEPVVETLHPAEAVRVVAARGEQAEQSTIRHLR